MPGKPTFLISSVWTAHLSPFVQSLFPRELIPRGTNKPQTMQNTDMKQTSFPYSPWRGQQPPGRQEARKKSNSQLVGSMLCLPVMSPPLSTARVDGTSWEAQQCSWRQSWPLSEDLMSMIVHCQLKTLTSWTLTPYLLPFSQSLPHSQQPHRGPRLGSWQYDQLKEQNVASFYLPGPYVARPYTLIL